MMRRVSLRPALEEEDEDGVPKSPKATFMDMVNNSESARFPILSSSSLLKRKGQGIKQKSDMSKSNHFKPSVSDRSVNLMESPVLKKKHFKESQGDKKGSTRAKR